MDSITQENIRKAYTYYVVEYNLMSNINFKVCAIKTLLKTHPDMSLLEAMNMVNGAMWISHK